MDTPDRRHVTKHELDGLIDTRLDGLTLKRITQADYDALAVKDPNILYVIQG